MNDRGVVLVAHNNGVLPYHKLAWVCSWFVKQHLDLPVCLIGDSATLEQASEHRELFDITRTINPDTNKGRQYTSRDGSDRPEGTFLNTSRPSIYHHSPFEQTLLIDTDFLVMGNGLNQVWETDISVMINKLINPVALSGGEELRRLHQLSIPQYWATVVYFRKSPEARMFFDGMEYVRQNYDYISRLYRFPSYLYRNDHSASVMAHLMNGSLGENAPAWPVQSLPDPELVFAWDNQPLLKIGRNRAWFIGHHSEGEGKYIPVMIKDRPVHVMNKQSILDVALPWVEAQL